MRTIISPPGIGDFLFIAQKLQNVNERFHIVMSDGKPQRGGQLKELLPNIIASHEYRQGITYNLIENLNAGAMGKRWNQIVDETFYLSANKHLEEGRRIEEFLPDLDTSFTLDYAQDESDVSIAATLLPKGPAYIGIYTSAYGTTRNWGFWGEKGWFRLIKLMHQMNKELVFVLIGASWDTDLTSRLTDLLWMNKMPFINTVGQPLNVVMQCMKLFTYAFYFPSGLAMLSETSGGSDATMFYPLHVLPKMPGTWCDPKRRESGQFKECYFCEPEAIFEWVRNEYCLFDKV